MTNSSMPIDFRCFSVIVAVVVVVSWYTMELSWYTMELSWYTMGLSWYTM